MLTDTAPITTLITPYETPGPESLLSSLLARTKGPIAGSIYGGNLPLLYDGLVAASGRGCPLLLLFDHTQEQGPSEKALYSTFVTKVPKGSSLVGTSPQHGQILHLKLLIFNAPILGYSAPQDRYPSIDAAMEAGAPVVWSGSWNFTNNASFQANNVDVIASYTRAAAFCGAVQQMHDFIASKEARYQV